MKIRSNIYNTLNIRGLKELPPFCKIFGNGITADNTASLIGKSPTPALLHQVSASCGRVFVCLFLAMFAFAFVACEKENYC